MATPLYKITYSFKNKISYIFVKDESFNVTGSIKYRPAKHMIEKAYELKEIDKNTTLYEVTSGNMGIAIAKAAKEFGNPVTIFMPSSMSEERKKMIKNLGANLILTKDFDDAFLLAEMRNDGYYLRQFENPYNTESYIEFAKELEKDLKNIPAFVAGVGTGGTLIGCGSYLKDKYHTKVIALEPKESLILSTGVNHGEHEIQGLSDGFIPKIYDKNVVDQIISISSVDSIVMTQKLISKFHLNIGISSGTNFLGAVLSEIVGAVTVFPDSSNRYMSTRLYDKSLSSELVDAINLIDLQVI